MGGYYASLQRHCYLLGWIVDVTPVLLGVKSYNNASSCHVALVMLEARDHCSNPSLSLIEAAGPHGSLPPRRLYQYLLS